MCLKSKDLAFTAVFAALYAIGVILLEPISFGVCQVRLADALLPLSLLFGMPVAFGTSLGCMVANVYGGLGPVDIVGGATANFLACTLAKHVGGETFYRRIIGCAVETATVAVIVGGYLSGIFGVPIEISFSGVLAGSIISINIVGFTILEILWRSVPHLPK